MGLPSRVWYRPLRATQYDGERLLPATVIHEGAVRVRIEVQCRDGSAVRASVSYDRLIPREPDVRSSWREAGAAPRLLASSGAPAHRFE